MATSPAGTAVLTVGYERDHDHCHRTLVTDRLRDAHPDPDVVHL